MRVTAGLVPECTYRIAARHEKIHVWFGTWDQIVTDVTITDPIGGRGR